MKVIRLTTMSAARELLRARGTTTQAGFTSERIPDGLFAHRPILMDDGPSHDEHRKALVRFFAPAKLDQDFIDRCARDAVDEARRAGGEAAVDEVALHYSVRVASRIVGLTHAPVEDLAQRLELFFRQPPVDHTAPDLGRTSSDWRRAAQMALGPLISLYFRDVRPAIKERRKRPRADIISHLLDKGYRPKEILVECLTYGTAGMVTTREFISLACWHLMLDNALRERFVIASEKERHAILNDLIRREPPVSHLYRRKLDDGALVDIDVRQANTDESHGCGLSFGDGAHRCPGSTLAIMEADALLLALFAANPTLESEPVLGYQSLVEGYQVRGLTVSFPASAS